MCCAPGACPAAHSSSSRTSTNRTSAGTSAAGTCGTDGWFIRSPSLVVAAATARTDGLRAATPMRKGYPRALPVAPACRAYPLCRANPGDLARRDSGTGIVAGRVRLREPAVAGGKEGTKAHPAAPTGGGGDGPQPQIGGGDRDRLHRAQPRPAHSRRPEALRAPVSQALGERRRAHIDDRGCLGRGGRRQPAQRSEQFLPAPAAPGQHGERVVVERLREHVTDRGEVLAGHAPVRARAGHFKITRGTREQRGAAVREYVLDLRGHLPGQQLGPEQGLSAERVGDPAPLGRGEREHADADLVRCRPGALHPRGDPALRQLEAQPLPGPGVAAPPGQPAAHAVRLQHVDEPAGPPRLADGAALTACPDAPVNAARPGGHLMPPGLAPAGSPAAGSPATGSHCDTASGDSASTVRRSATDNSVSQPSPVPTTCSASAFFSSIMASIRSSSVPTQTNLRTCTSLRWPMRNARSVA